MQGLHLFLCLFSSSAKVILASLLLQHFQYILQLVYQLIFLCTNNFCNLNILQHHMIYRIHIHNYLDSKQILYCIHLSQSILYIHTCIYLYSTFAYYYKHLHLVYICIYKFHVILCFLCHKFLKLNSKL